MNVLVIGGTKFIGRHIADALVARRHRVTLFNRGSVPSVHANLEQIHGDRTTDLSRLDGRTWDAVIDMCGYTPDVVEAAAAYFSARAHRYLFVSTVSVYDHAATSGPDEESPLVRLPEGADPAVFDWQYYGALKVLCEQAVRRSFRGRTTVVRPALVAGPYDPTDRFTYWPVRFDEGGTVLTPLPQSRIQYVDARDLAAFAVHLVEREEDGTFNCLIPPATATFGDLCEACMHEASSEDAQPLPCSDEFLAAHDVRPWSELPLWIPASSAHASMANASAKRALAAGLSVRALAHTVRDTLAWARTAEKRPGAMGAGLTPEREAQLLAALK